MRLWITMVAAIIFTVIVLGFLFREQILRLVMPPRQSTVSESPVSPDNRDIETAATNLDTPWAIAHLPNGDLLITERSGQLRRLGEGGTTHTVQGVRETSEGGLLGLVLHPEFSNNKLLYLYLTTDEGGQLTNRVERYRFDNDRLTERTDIVTGIPASANHDGGLLTFGPSGHLYITTGDAGNQNAAQDTTSLAGKILRLDDDGGVPADNPFDNPVWSYGHRNPQGLTWDNKGQLWETEHGPSGTASGRDELNLIEKGANYGWPTITGDETAADMRSPIAQSGDNDTWAPGDIAYADGSLYFTGLRGQSLYEAVIGVGNTVELKRHFTEAYGRLRAVTAKDNALYISTSNHDGRGNPVATDDRIIRIPLSILHPSN